MKISVEQVDRIREAQAIVHTNGNGSNGNGKATVANGHSPAASVEFSPTTQEIQRVKQLVNETPDVREELVQSLKSRIEKGTYNVSGADIADLMVLRAFEDKIR